ncbi:uromodulin-like 1 [Ochotona princeps]|uniref:uromodulin-like 1 n=1 Tax=Ochotona princeps TaxID=9978 RepID=UPI0027151B9A|nr:uromodulin-like 1 [Ochotona princeps]
MLRASGLALLALVNLVSLSWASGFTETGLSLLGYQLCERLVTQHIRRVEATQTSHISSVSCGGWIPWRRCPKTVYSTQYVAVDVPEARNVTNCCEGYEQLGFYCVLPLNRSGGFTSRPGVCPAAGAGPGASASPCSTDADCPGLNKCCPWLGGRRCVAPTPQGAVPENMLAWYNVTILVKMDFQDLLREDPRLLNHTRLLGSLVLSALQPLNASVHHLRSASGDPSTTLSWLLLGLPQLLPVASVSGMLDELVRRVYEVVSVQVQDVNECLYEELSTCSGAELCVNEEGWHRCTGVQGSSAGPHPQLRSHLEEDCPPVSDHVAHSVTSTGFRVSWSSSLAQNCTFHVQVSRGGVPLSSSWTRAQTAAVAGLEAGALYEVKTSYQGCGANVSAVLAVKTEAQLFRVTLRIVDRNLTVELQDPSSSEYQAFVSQLLQEVEKSLPPAVSDLHRRGKLWIHLVSLQAGSVVATLRLTVQDPEFPLQVSTLSPMLGPLWASTVFLIDRQGTQVQDWDECADSSENDCSPAARCINLEGSYTCQCRAARDVNPSRSGRACEGDMGSPTEAVPSAAAGVMAPSLGTATAALSAENPTLTSSARHLQGTQTHCPGGPALPPSSGTLSSVPSSYQGATTDLLDTHGQFLGTLATKPPTEDPTGHVMWHTTLPVWETPLSPTQKKNEYPSLPGSPALPRTPTLASLRTPTCAPVLIERITVSNVTSYGFHLAWVASLALRPTFQLTLNPALSSTVGLETQDTRVVLSGLQPGVLHLVELVAKACGKEGTPAHLKVRTVARKLGGQVRIANVSFSESLSNTSSREHREFLQVFLKAVRGSLPAVLCQQLDAGGVRLEVTRITNGSVVVEFHLLIIADVDVGEVSAAFLAALQNMTMLEVVPSDTFLQDYDECATGEDDCAPGTTCRNTLGSFSCDCEEEELDLPIEYSGRSCEGDFPGSTVPAPSPVGSSPAPSGPSPRLTLSSAVRVLCEMEKVVVAVQKQFLRQEAVPESSLYLGQPACNVSHSNRSHALLVAGWGECGTLVQSNKTDTVVRTTLRSDLSPDGVIRHLRILSPIHCAFRNHLLTSSGYTPEWGVYTVIEDLHGAGSFVTEMQLFVGESPIPQNHSVSASDDVKIEVGLFTHKGNLKVVLTECWATPSSNAQDPVTFGFINNSCPVPNTYTRVIENGDSHKAQFKLRIFSFINTSLVYLHCQLRVCLEAPGASCKINCNDLRVLRSGETSAMHQTSWGPLVRSIGAPVGPKPGLSAGYVALIVAGVLGVLAGAAALVVVRFQRMTGNYSIKLRSDNFSYREFSQ